MKNVIMIGLFMLGLTFQGMSQDVLFEAKLKKEDVPQLVTEAITEDFPDFEVTEVSAVPVEFVDDDVIIHKNIKKDIKDGDYSTYEFKLEGKGREIDATYDSDGNLKSSYEYMKDMPLPTQVAKMIEKKYPGWAITKDNYKLSHYHGKTTTERYKVILTKGNDRKKVFIDMSGDTPNVS